MTENMHYERRRDVGRGTRKSGRQDSTMRENKVSQGTPLHGVPA